MTLSRDAVAQVDELPVAALSEYAELIAFLELTPWEGGPYRADKPDGNMRVMPSGSGSRAWLSTSSWRSSAGWLSSA